MPSGAETTPVPWATHHRIIPSRFPPIGVFEDTADPEDLETVFEVEALTNDRLRDQAGELHRVAPEDRVSGPNATVVMAAFTRIGRAARFNDEYFGAYYAGNSTDVAVAETRFHRERFMSYTCEQPQVLDMREYVGEPTGRLFVDLRGARPRNLLDPDPTRYDAPQAFAQARRAEGADGILYPSVRMPGGECLAAFRPTAVGLPRQAGHFRYVWDGERISRIERVTRYG